MFLGSASINGAYCVYCIFLHAQVEELEKESLPKSASEVVTQVLKQAVENKNSPEVIKPSSIEGSKFGFFCSVVFGFSRWCGYSSVSLRR